MNKLSPMVIAVVVASVGFGAARMSGVHGEVYKDFAHVWIGLVLGLWIEEKSFVRVDLSRQLPEVVKEEFWVQVPSLDRSIYRAAFWFLGAVEVTAAVVTRWADIVALVHRVL